MDQAEQKLIWLVVDAGTEKRPIPGTYKTEPFLKTRRLFSTAEAADDHATSLGGMQVSRTVGIESRYMSGSVDVWSIALPLPSDLAASWTQANQEIAATKAALVEERAEYKEFRRRLLGALKPVGIEKGLLDIELAAVRTQELETALAKIRQLEAGIAAYRKRAADPARQNCDLDDADAWEASLIDVDGRPTEETR